MKFTVVAALAVASIGMAGCVSTNATVLGTNTTAAAIAPADVAIYRTPSQVPGAYDEVAILNSKGDANWTNEKKMFQSMRKEAAKLGANGVILDNVKEPGAGARVAAAVFGVGVARKGTSIAIRTKAQ